MINLDTELKFETFGMFELLIEPKESAFISHLGQRLSRTTPMRSET
jgi:hypothetical protein